MCCGIKSFCGTQNSPSVRTQFKAFTTEIFPSVMMIDAGNMAQIQL